MEKNFTKITSNPAVQFGKTVIAGTRVPVEVIVGHITAGNTPEQVATDYGIKLEDVRAALKYVLGK